MDNKEIMSEIEVTKKLTVYKDTSDNKYYIDDCAGNRVEIPSEDLAFRISKVFILNELLIEPVKILKDEDWKPDFNLLDKPNESQELCIICKTNIAKYKSGECGKCYMKQYNKNLSEKTNDLFDEEAPEASYDDKIIKKVDKAEPLLKKVSEDVPKICMCGEDATHKGGLCKSCYMKEYNLKQKKKKEQQLSKEDKINRI